MNKYLKLLSNTLIFGIGTFSSKLLVFVMMPVYTRLLSTAQYGVADIIVSTAQLLFPVVGLSIGEAVMRYAIESKDRHKQVFSTGVVVTIIGFLLFLLFLPVFFSIAYIRPYTWLVYAYVLMACINNVCMNATRARGMVKLYAFMGLLNTLLVVGFNLLFLMVFKMGVVGFVLSTVLADAVSSLVLFVATKLYRLFSLRCLSRAMTTAMLRYCLPMIPNSLFWWITNISDRYFVTAMLGDAVNGLYAVAYKVPTIINVVVLIFTQAWNISAFTEYGNKESTQFFSRVFKVYTSVIFLAGAAVIALIKPLTSFLVSPQFYDSWRYVPLLVLSVVFSCFVTFLGSIYMASKKNTMSMVTTMIGAISNIGMNCLLIPRFGANGAAFATAMSYLIVFICRAIDTRRFMKIQYDLPLLAANMALVCAQTAVMMAEPAQEWVWQGLFVLAIVLINFKMLWAFVQKLWSGLKHRTQA